MRTPIGECELPSANANSRQRMRTPVGECELPSANANSDRRMRTPIGECELPSANANSHQRIGIPIENKKNRRPHRSGSGEPQRDYVAICITESLQSV